MKTIHFLKRCFSALLFCLAMIYGAKTNAQTVTINPVVPAAKCIDAGPSSMTYTYTINTTGGTDYYRWSTRGDLEIVGYNSDSTQVYVRSVASYGSTRDPYGKGRLYLMYRTPNSEICGDPQIHYDIYKRFDNLSKAIVGPECISAGDTVTYSIDAMVSVNQNQQIGIDGYYWTYTANLVDHVLYFSGDSSSITFVAGPVGTADSLMVDVGQCNVGGFLYSLKIGQSIDTPVFTGGHAPPNCLPFGQDAPKLIFTPQAGVTYSWSTNGSWGVSSNARGDTAQLFPDNSTGEIVLTAINQCETKTFEYKIFRSLSDSSYIVASTYTCLPSGQNKQFFINGVSGGVKMQWNVTGPGWQLLPGQENSTSPFILTGTGPGTLIVSTFDCPSVKDTLEVYIKPGNPIAVSGATCIPAGSTANRTYSTTAVTNVDYYEWYYPSGWTAIGTTTSTSVVLQPDGTTSGFVKVVAKGCSPSDTAQLYVSFSGVPPENIIPSKGCFNVGLPDTVIYSVSPTRSGEHYEWQVASGLGTIFNYNGTSDSSQIKVATLGVAGTYTVKARSKTNCGTSSYTTYTANVVGLTFTVETIKAGSTRSFFVDPDPVVDATYYKWYWNGVPYEEGAEITGISIQGNPTSGTACVEVTSTSGCITRKCKSFPTLLKTSQEPENTDSGNITTTWNAYPNPASDVLTIDFSTSGQYSTFLFDATGKLVSHKKMNGSSDKMDTHSLPAGSYTLIVRSEKINQSKTIIISK